MDKALLVRISGGDTESVGWYALRALVRAYGDNSVVNAVHARDLVTVTLSRVRLLALVILG